MHHFTLPRALAALPVLAALAVTGTPSALAAPDQIVRQPDMSLSPCLAAAPTAPGQPVPSRPPGVACTIHAVGDFNGDRVDDLLVSQGIAGDVAGGAEDFLVVVGPLDPRAEPRAGIPVHMPGGSGPARAALTDVDGDGTQDLVLSRGELAGNTLAVVLGGRQWMLPDAPQTPVPFDLRFTRRVPIGERPIGMSPLDMVTVAFADLNGDGYQDALVGADTTIGAIDALGRSAAGDLPQDASSIAVMFGHGDWARETVFRDDLVVRGLGTCTDRPSLAGVADVTGDGLPDILARQCPGSGQPDRPGMVDGATLAVATSELGQGRTVTIGTTAPAVRLPPPGLGPIPGLPGLLAAPFGGSLDGEIPPPDPGRGYLPAGGAPERPAPYFLEDVSGDGVKDILFGLGEHTHVWLGGAGLAERLDALRSDRVYAHAGFGMSTRVGAWRPADLDRDGSADLLLTGREDLTCPDNARCRSRESRPDRAEITALRFFRSGWTTLPVIDVDLDPPGAIWNTGEQTVWAMGDFNGDGATDILLGDTRGATSAYGLVFGPF